jgi:hypothetical protein
MKKNRSGPVYVGTGEASRYFGVTPHTLRKWAKAQKVPAILSPGGRYLFDITGAVERGTARLKEKLATKSAEAVAAAA